MSEKPSSVYRNTALYKSSWRALVRAGLQRVIFRAVLHSAVTPVATVEPGVKKVKGAFLLVANHSSHLDAPMLAQGLPFAQGKNVSTGVAHDYFFTTWYRRWFVRWMFNAFPIDRDGSRTHSGLSRELLKGGVPVLVFPEGTRSKTGKMAEFKPGAAALAIGCQVPVIPAAIIGAHEAMPKGRNWPTPGRPKVGVVFGEPLYPREGASAMSFNTQIQDAVKRLYKANRASIVGDSSTKEN